MPRINLLPAEWRTGHRTPEDWIPPAAIAAIGAYFLLSLGYIEWSNWKSHRELSRLQSRIEELNDKITPLKTRTLASEKNTVRFERLRSILERRNGWSGAFREFSDRLPSGVWLTALTSVRQDGKRRFIVQGESLSQEKMAHFLDELSKSPEFSGAAVNVSEIRPDVQPEIYRFELSVPVAANSDGGSP